MKGIVSGAVDADTGKTLYMTWIDEGYSLFIQRLNSYPEFKALQKEFLFDSKNDTDAQINISISSQDKKQTVTISETVNNSVPSQNVDYFDAFEEVDDEPLSEPVDAEKKTEVSKQEDTELLSAIEDDSKVQEATQALQVLGYTRREIEDVISKVKTKDLSVEEIIRQCLANLAR